MLEESKTLGFELKPSYLHTENGDPNFQRIDWSKDLYLLNKMCSTTAFTAERIFRGLLRSDIPCHVSFKKAR